MIAKQKPTQGYNDGEKAFTNIANRTRRRSKARSVPIAAPTATKTMPLSYKSEKPRNLNHLSGFCVPPLLFRFQITESWNLIPRGPRSDVNFGLIRWACG